MFRFKTSQIYLLLCIFLAFTHPLNSVLIEDIKQQDSSDSDDEYSVTLFDLSGTIKKIIKENHFDSTELLFTQDEKIELFQDLKITENYFKKPPKPNPKKDRETLKKLLSTQNKTVPLKNSLDNFLLDYWIDDDEPTIDPLNLNLLDTKQSEQSHKPFENASQLYIYNKKTIDIIFKTFYIKNKNGEKTIRPKECHIDSIYRLVSKYSDVKQPPIALFWGHGTWGHNNPDYFDPNSKLFQGLLRFAFWITSVTGRRVDMYVVKWSGDNTKQARESAGQILSRIVEMVDHYYDFIIFKGFSHMGNVFNHASSHLVYARILLALYFATPTLDWMKGHAPHNIDWTIIKSSDDDGVKHWVGTWTDRLYSLLFWWRYHYDPCKKIKDNSRFSDHRSGIVTNLDCMIDNTYSGHSIFPHRIINHVPKIITKLLTNYTQKEALYHLLVNIIPKEKAERLAIKEYNISLAPPENANDNARLSKVKSTIKQHSKKQEEDHSKAYPGYQKGTRWIIATYYNRWRKMFH